MADESKNSSIRRVLQLRSFIVPSSDGIRVAIEKRSWCEDEEEFGSREADVQAPIFGNNDVCANVYRSFPIVGMSIRWSQGWEFTCKSLLQCSVTPPKDPPVHIYSPIVLWSNASVTFSIVLSIFFSVGRFTMSYREVKWAMCGDPTSGKVGWNIGLLLWYLPTDRQDNACDWS